MGLKISYSRWSNSRWYTFYHAASGLSRQEQFFEICSVKSFTYPEMKANIEGCLEEVRKVSPDASEEEMQELKKYMLYFIADVESDKDVNFYDELISGKVSEELIAWAKEVQERNYDEDLKEATAEALKVLETKRDDLPIILSEIKSVLGKTLLEQRLKNRIP